MKSGIYIIINKINGHKYIGQSNNIKRRWTEHKSPSKRKGIVLDRAILKYGIKSFNFVVLEYCDVKSLDELEIFYIKTIKPEYNMNDGGSGNKGLGVSNKTKKILSKKAKKQWDLKTEEEKRFIIDNNLKTKKGHNVSKETRRKISKKLKGNQTSDLQKKRASEVNKILLKGNCRRKRSVCQIDIKTFKIISIFKTVKDAAEKMNIHPSGIINCCKNKQRTAGGYTWKYNTLECRDYSERK